MANDVLLSYDIKKDPKGQKRNDEIKKGMMKKGYADCFVNETTKNISYLPNTTLWKADTKPVDARNDLDTIVANVNKEYKEQHSVERFIAVAWGGTWASYHGEKWEDGCKCPVKS